MTERNLKIQGAREHNLKNLSLEIKHDQLTVITGLSGAGKSTLAFDTIHAEGQQRYVETFSTYTRQFFDKIKKPDLDVIENVRPSIAIEQRTRIKNSRSTVSSLTDISDYVSLIWSHLSEPACSTCGISLRQPTTVELIDKFVSLLSSCSNKTFLIAAKIRVNKKKGKNEIDRLIQLGYSRFLDQQNQKIEKLENLKKLLDNELTIVLERLRPPVENLRDRLSQTISQGYSIGSDLLDLLLLQEVGTKSGTQRPWLKILQSDENISLANVQYLQKEFLGPQSCGQKLLPPAKVKPALFSWNNPIGACPECRGFGSILAADRGLVVPDPRLSVKKGAISCWTGPASQSLQRRLEKYCFENNIPIDKPWLELTPEQQKLIFEAKTRQYIGVQHWFKKLEKKSYRVSVRAFLSRYRKQFDCPACLTRRLRPESLRYVIFGLNIAEFMSLRVDQALSCLAQWQTRYELQGQLDRSLKELFKIVTARLKFMQRLGLGYLNLDRQARTLSGGETQRVSLASALGSDLVNTQFVLDEPTVGLHPQDTGELVSAIRDLQTRGNTVVVVEHDPDFIMQADQVVELGPQAGATGGSITYSGPVTNWNLDKISPTYNLEDAKKPKAGFLSISEAKIRNLNNLSVNIPIGLFNCLTGVSGSGKSTLIEEVLLKNWTNFKINQPANYAVRSIDGFNNFSTVELLDQHPIGKTPRANLATYCAFWERIRILLAKSDSAQQLGLEKSDFSFNVDGGRCPTCKGAGFVKESMQFLSDVFLPCDVCLGERFLPKTLQVKINGKSVSEILHLTVAECLLFFSNEPAITEPCQILIDLGLDHLQIGHPLSELSGGEAQRLKLIPFLQRANSQEKALLILDEPTTGLHVRDIDRLLLIIQKLKAAGHTIICVEHNPLMILNADWIIDLGPGAGPAGGNLVVCGSPAELIMNANKNGIHSPTATHLKAFHDNWNKRAKGPNKKIQNNSISKISDTPELEIVGAREHNLKNFDLKIPYQKIVALTGLSGSGKSTLARDIIHAEGQRRYLDCLSPYARQFITELKKPLVDQVKNIAPTICIQQHATGISRISTLATLSEVYSYLRLLISKTGQLFCPTHPEVMIEAMTATELAGYLKSQHDENLRVLAPVIKLKKGTHTAVLAKALNSELAEVRIDGKFYKTKQAQQVALEKSKVHSIDFVLGRFNPQSLDEELIHDCLEEAFILGGGSLIVVAGDKDNIFSQERACPVCHRGFLKPDPEDLSFSSRRGKCAKCEGTGINASGQKCPSCNGQRLGEVGRNVRLAGKNISELCQLRPSELLSILERVSLPSSLRQISEPIIFELKNKLGTLIELGLDLLQLDRECRTLSGGELQRLRLAATLGTPLNGVLYVMDEPSANLHPLDHVKVLQKIQTLKQMGNSILLIEHDPDSILNADQIIEIGPEAGAKGGELIFNGSLKAFISEPYTETATLLKGYLDTGCIYPRPDSTKSNNAHQLTIHSSASCNNINPLRVEIPLNQLVVVAGVSGAGKSTLTNSILLQTIHNCPGEKKNWNTALANITSTVEIDKILSVDQTPIGANSRSTPASYLGILDHLRKVFAVTLEAKTHGYTASHFSYNSGSGRCAHCKGLGEIKLEMSFLPEARVICPECNGRRYTSEILAVRYLNHNFSELLELTISETYNLFVNHRQIGPVLRCAIDLGLGYLKLGQSSATLSGGESQRLKLALELANQKNAHNLYILDEPSIGLHPKDLARLISVLKNFVAAGHSVLVIEHDLQMLQASDWIVEMGPGAADQGGQVIFEGPYENLRKAKTPWGTYLSKHQASYQADVKKCIGL
jgi:excinuclease ABC subunit A